MPIYIQTCKFIFTVLGNPTYLVFVDSWFPHGNIGLEETIFSEVQRFHGPWLLYSPRQINV